MIELSITLCLCLFLLCIGIAHFDRLSQRIEQNRVFEQLMLMIELGKQLARSTQQSHWICPTLDQRTCHHSTNWSHGFLLFGPHKTHHIMSKLRHGTLHYYGFGSQINIHSNGTTDNVGTFTYFPHNTPNDCSQLILNKTLRSYAFDPNTQSNHKENQVFGR